MDVDGNPVKLRPMDLPSDIMLFKDGRFQDLSTIFNVNHEFDSAYIIVHDKTSKMNGLMKIDNVKNELPPGIAEGYYDAATGEVHNNIFASDAHGNYLYSRIELKTFKARADGWYSEFTNADGKLQKEFYVAFGFTSSNQYVCFLFDTKLILNPKEINKNYLASIKTLRGPRNVIIGDVQIKTQISEEIALSISNLLSMTLELFNVFPLGLRRESQEDIAHRDMVITDSLVTLHDPNTDLAHITRVIKFLEPRATDKNLYDANDPSAFLEGFTHFKKLDQNKIAKNKIDSFIFRNTLLKLIQNVFDRGPNDNSYQYFKEVLGNQLFNYLDGKVFAGDLFNNQDFLVDSSAGIDETLLIETLDKAIEKLFGYTTTLFLKLGLMSFTRDNLNNYIVEFVAHSNLQIFEFSSKFQIRSLVGGETKAALTLRKEYNKFVEEILSMILSGNQERITTTDLNEDMNDDFLFQKATPYRSPLLNGLFDNIVEGSTNLRHHQVIRYEFMNWFFRNIDSKLKVRELFIEGRQILESRITKMLKDQVSLDKIIKYFRPEIMTMVAHSNGRSNWIECVNIKRLQVIQYLARIYTEAVYFPKNLIGPAAKTNSMEDIALLFRNLLKDPNLDTAFIPFVTVGTPNNQFFKEFWLTFSLKEFSSRDINLIIPTLGYTYNTLPPKNNRFKGEFSHLYDLMAIMPELREQIQDLSKNFKFYFSNYIGTTGIKDFAVKFYLTKNNGFVPTKALLKDALYSSFKKDTNGQIIDELKGEFLEFTINNNADLDKMVANIIYYMLKYKCIAAVNEGQAVKFDSKPTTKYALIASPERLYNTNFLLTSFDVSIKNDELSATAIELYRNLFGLEQTDLYLLSVKQNPYSAIWNKDSIHSPYLMRNSHLFKQYFIRIFGQRNDIIEDLRNDYRPIP